MKTLEEWVKELPEDFRKLISVSGFRNVNDQTLKGKVNKRVAMLYIQKFIHETLEKDGSMYYRWIALCIVDTCANAGKTDILIHLAEPAEYTATKLIREYHVSYWLDPYTSSGRTVYGKSIQDATSQICELIKIDESKIIYVHAK